MELTDTWLLWLGTLRLRGSMKGWKRIIDRIYNTLAVTEDRAFWGEQGDDWIQSSKETATKAIQLSLIDLERMLI